MLNSKYGMIPSGLGDGSSTPIGFIVKLHYLYRERGIINVRNGDLIDFDNI